MEPRWSGSYDLVVVYQAFLSLLVALIGTLACMGALASLVFVSREFFAGFYARPTIASRQDCDYNIRRRSDPDRRSVTRQHRPWFGFEIQLGWRIPGSFRPSERTRFSKGEQQHNSLQGGRTES